MANNHCRPLFNLTEGFHIEILDFDWESQVPQEIVSKIDMIWSEAKNSNPTLFDDSILNAINITKERIRGCFVPYRYYLAQLRDRTLINYLDLHAVCITGVTQTENKILIGKRSEQVAQFSNFFELIPAGGIDPSSRADDSIDIIMQYFLELREETHISEDKVEGIHPFIVIENPMDDSYEICARINLKDSIKVSQSQEHVEIFWLEVTEISEFLKQHQDEIVPISHYILENIFK